MTLSSNSGLSSITADQPCEQRAKQLNSQCRCVSLNREAMHAELKQRQDDNNLYHKIFEDRPHLFAESAVFVTDTCLQKQHRIIAAIESVIALPAYQKYVLAYAPDTAKYIPKAHGVFFGYDFHLSDDGPQLIEINTNAGGALLNAIVLRSQKVCCDLTEKELPTNTINATLSTDPEQAFVEMFLEIGRAHV